MIDDTFRTSEGPRLFSLLGPVRMGCNIWSRRELVWQLARRDLAAKYRASYLGMLWTVLSPLILLAVYTFIFSVVLEMRWKDDSPPGHGLFAITMFIGMLIFNVFSEVLNRATTLITSHPNFVKKVVFPLEVMVPAVLLSSLGTMGIGLLVWGAGKVILLGWPTATALLLPVVVLPVFLLTLGLGWFVAALGVFIRDVSQIVVVLTQVLFVLTPIFYSIERLERSRVPAYCIYLIRLNPLTSAVEGARSVTMAGTMPDWSSWTASLVCGALAALAGYAFFMKSRRAFGDVV